MEKMKQAIKRLEATSEMIKVPLSSQKHVEQMKIQLPSVLEDLVEAYEELTGEKYYERESDQ